MRYLIIAVISLFFVIGCGEKQNSKTEEGAGKVERFPQAGTDESTQKKTPNKEQLLEVSTDFNTGQEVKKVEQLSQKIVGLSLEELAEQGDADSQFKLAQMYKTGQGVTKDLSQAVEWVLKAAQQGHVDAQVDLAVCYYDGKGVAKNSEEAVRWFRKAAEQGDSVAQIALEKIARDAN